MAQRSGAGVASIILVTFWWNTGYYMLIYMAGLQEIPAEQYEAAAIDGATGWQRLWRITIPCLRRTHLLVLFLQAIASFKIFGQVFLITEGGPGAPAAPCCNTSTRPALPPFRWAGPRRPPSCCWRSF